MSVPKRPPIIGVCGGIGCGKDAFASAVIQLFPEYRIAKFAAALRRVVSRLIDVPVERMLDTEGKAAVVSLPPRDSLLERAKELDLPPQTTAEDLADFLEAMPPVTVGRLLQVLGTEFFRRRDPDFWVRALFDGCDGGPLVISDVRFPNEADAIRARGGVVVEIRSKIRRPASMAGRDPRHESERGVAADFVLDNDGTLEDLLAAVASLLQK